MRSSSFLFSVALMSPPDPREWFLLIKGQSHGPYTESEIRTFVHERKVLPKHRVRNAEADDWIRISESQFAGDTSEEAMDPGAVLDRELEMEHSHQPQSQGDGFWGSGTARNFKIMPLEEWLEMDRNTLVQMAKKAQDSYTVFSVKGRNKKR